MNKGDILIKINQLYKIFGHNPIEALDLVKMVWARMNFLKNQTVFLV